MTSIRTAVYCLAVPAAILFSLPSYGQEPVHKDMISMDRLVRLKPVPISRWILTFNPYALLEPPAALGLGIGYRLNRRVELWSETSLLRNILSLRHDPPIRGFRQVLELRYFPGKDPNLFLGVEARYKSVQRWETNDFYNSATQDTLLGYGSRSNRYFFGMALQVGYRGNLGKSKRFQVEAVVGLGFKNACVAWKNIPKGYVEHNFNPPFRESPFNSDVGEYSGPYLPCTLRVICLLGKKL